MKDWKVDVIISNTSNRMDSEQKEMIKEQTDNHDRIICNVPVEIALSVTFSPDDKMYINTGEHEDELFFVCYLEEREFDLKNKCIELYVFILDIYG